MRVTATPGFGQGTVIPGAGEQVTAAAASAADAAAGRLLLARQELLGGRGPGASDAEIAEHTRDRAVIAGVGTTRRLEATAQETARARGDTAAIANDIGRSGLELAHTVSQLAVRVSPARLVERERGRVCDAAVRHPAAVTGAVLLAGGLLALRCRRRSVTRTP